jgi:hypothetical protein
MTRFGEVSGEAEIKNVKFETDGATGSLKDSAAADIACDARIKVTIGGTVYYIPAYSTIV